ncbi:alpha/beta fold hydrolase [Alteromonas gracilis]|uniref:alpha/beta fold hydrolase n=1 Tax=Alteromonas gracilis TaxID=1479524 RepID=UPI003734FC9A
MITSHYAEINGHAIHYLYRKSNQKNQKNQKLLVMLHGFPENAHTWEGLISLMPPYLDIIAPDLPGYHHSSPLSDISLYQLPALIARMAAFIENIQKGREIILVGHDWGGAVAWPLAAFHQTLFKKLIIINAAHPSTFTLSLKNSSLQREKSQYIHNLTALNAEQKLENSGFRLLKQMLGEELFESESDYAIMLQKDWARPVTLTSMLNYYRQMPQQVPCANAAKAELDKIRIPQVFIRIPTLVLWGEKDDAFDISVLDNIEHYVPMIEMHFNKAASHWLHREHPQWVLKRIVDFVEA